MQLIDLTPQLEQSGRDAWNPDTIYPDAPRTEQRAARLIRLRIELQDGGSQASGGGAASRDAVLPQTYALTGTFPYPSGSEDTVSAHQVARWNEMVAVLTADYPLYAGWRYSEEIGWEFSDNAEEETYDVTVLFTLLVITSVRT